MISIIIVNHNGKKWLHDCLKSLLRQTYDHFEIIIVDNASTDDSVNFIKKNYPKIRIIENKINIGYGRANNLGARKAAGEIIFFLNNDTVLEKDTLEKLLRDKEKDTLHITGPRLLNFDGKDIHEGYKVTIDPTGYLGSGQKTFFIDGCALMIGKKDFFNLDGFDEKYFMYCEDIDLCWRAHLYGMNVEMSRDAALRHFAGGTMGRTQYKSHGDHTVPLMRRYEVEKNNLRNILKNYKTINLLWVIPFYEFQSLGECLVYVVTGNFEAMKVVVKAHLWNLGNIGDTLYNRKIIQRNRIVGDGKILSMMFFGLNKFLAFRSIGLPKFT